MLERVAALPVSTWSYKHQSPAMRHMGPMAQDFAAAFGLGSDERVIEMVDANGVLLAAVQGLYQVVQEQGEELRGLRSELAELRCDSLVATS